MLWQSESCSFSSYCAFLPLAKPTGFLIWWQGSFERCVQSERKSSLPFFHFSSLPLCLLCYYQPKQDLLGRLPLHVLFFRKAVEKNEHEWKGCNIKSWKREMLVKCETGFFCFWNVLMYRLSDGEAVCKFIASWSDATAATMQCNS